MIYYWKCVSGIFMQGVSKFLATGSIIILRRRMAMKKINVVITSGGTEESIDSVRKIGNMSSGRLGARICDEFFNQAGNKLGKVFYICSKNAVLPRHHNQIEVIKVSTVQSLQKAVEDVLTKQKIHYFVHSMAVSDFTVASVSTSSEMSEDIAKALSIVMKNGILSEDQIKNTVFNTLESNKPANKDKKISSRESDLLLRLVQTPKIISLIKQLQPETFLIGFKLLNRVSRSDLFESGFQLLRTNRCNLVFANDLADIRSGMHTGLLIFPEKDHIMLRGKEVVARDLVSAALKRGETRYIRSICACEEPRTPISSDVYLAFQSIGEKLFEEGYLPVVESGTYGNMSVRDGKSKFVITGRNVDKGKITKDMLVRILTVNQSDEEKHYADILYEGNVKPSIDAAIHAAIYNTAGCKAIMHIHTDKILYGIPIATNYACGTEDECNAIIDAFQRGGQGTHTIQIYKHGLITIGENLEECLEKLQILFENAVSINKIQTDGEKVMFNEWLKHLDEVNVIESPLPIRDLEHFYVIIQEGKRKGVLFIHENGQDALTFIIYLLPEYRSDGKGVGAKTIDIVTELGKLKGKSNLVIQTIEECGVVEYYTKKHGFKITDRDEKIYKELRFLLCCVNKIFKKIS